MTKLSTNHSLRKKSDEHLQKIGFSTISSSRYTIDLLMVGAYGIVNSFDFPIVAYAEINVFANLNRIGYSDCIWVFIFWCCRYPFQSRVLIEYFLETYLGSYLTSRMTLNHYFRSEKSSIVDAWQSYKYVSFSSAKKDVKNHNRGIKSQ